MALGNAYVSDPIAGIWYGAKEDIPGVRFGGAYADKPGYHNTRKRNQQRWPGNYSTKLDMDLKGSALLVAAIDLTMSTAEMTKRTGYLRRAALDPRDTRLRCLREFIGTLDGRRVYCRIGGNAGLGQGRGSDDWGRDSSHLWHIHLSILRAFANDGVALEGVISVLSGETWEAWARRKWGSSPTLPVAGIPGQTLREPDSGPAVLALQVYLNAAIGAGLVEDGDFGPATSAAVRELQRRAGITIDGVYGRESAAALRDLLEDGMPLNNDDVKRFWHTDGLIEAPGYALKQFPTNKYWSAASYLKTTRERVESLLAETRAVRSGQAAILAAVKGLDTDAVIAAVEQAAAADAARDAALLAELQGLADGGATAQDILDALAARLASPAE